MSTVLVVGGAGYIGSHTALALSEAGHYPIVFDNLSTGNRWAVKWGPFEEGDIHDYSRLVDVFNKHRPEAVFHFAGSCEVGESIEKPLHYYHNNVAGTVTLLRAMASSDCHQLVFSSTCATFGIPDNGIVDDFTTQKPINPYGRSKLFIENIIADSMLEFPLNSAILRYFNAAGADPQGRIGEAHEPESHLIPRILQCALGQRHGIEVLGSDYPTEDGTCVRDFIHVTDLACAHVKAFEWLIKEKRSESFNLGSGVGASVREILDVCRETTGCNISANNVLRRKGDPPILISKSDKAQKLLGWEPQNSNIKKIVKDAWSWHSLFHKKAEVR